MFTETRAANLHQRVYFQSTALTGNSLGPPPLSGRSQSDMVMNVCEGGGSPPEHLLLQQLQRHAPANELTPPPR